MKPVYSKAELENRKREAEARFRTDRDRYLNVQINTFDNKRPTALIQCTKEDIKMLLRFNSEKLMDLEAK